MGSLKPPRPLVINNDIDMAREWSEWLDAYECYTIAAKVNTEKNEIILANFKTVIGREAIRLINNLGLTEDEKKDLDKIKKKLKEHFVPMRNKTYERCQFHRIRQQESETFDDFLQKIREQVQKCEFNNNDEFITDQIALGIRCENTQQKLWIEDELTMEKAIKICRAAERANRQINDINEAAKVNKISKEFNCRRCKTTHGPKSCPAYKKECLKCGGTGHFSIACRSHKNRKEGDSKSESKNKKSHKKNKSQEHKKVDVIENDSINYEKESSSDETGFKFIGMITTVNSITEEKWTEKVRVGKYEVKLRLDTGAYCNVISIKTARAIGAVIAPSEIKKIKSYDGGLIKVIGQTKLKCRTLRKENNIEGKVIFTVINENLQTILGGADCENLGFLKRVNQIGCCKNFEYDMDFIDNPKFKIIPARKIPYAIEEKVRQEIQNMIKLGVIESVSEPTPAVSPMLVVNKGKIRVCMDPTELNKNIKRRIYPMKTVEEVAAKTHGSKFFTKLDCEKGFWQIKVTERTSKYLTFSTPWGRFKYLRMPFGISSAPEVFAEVMNRTLEGIDRCEVVMDDTFLHAPTLKELRETTKTVIKRLTDAGFTLNKEKCEYEKTSVKFLGHIFTINGYEADKNKVVAINQLKTPTCVKELQRILGMVNYLGKFISNMSELTEPLRKLLHKEAAWCWETEHTRAFEKIKKVLTSTPVLAYYDVNKPVKLSVDASSKSMGACLMQEGKPVAYATRAFTTSQLNQPQIVKEALAIRFGCQKFHEYVYGKELSVETDHKPLETIFLNPIQNAPLRLQRILFDILQYSPKIKYIRGTAIPIADVLSRDCEIDEYESDETCAINLIHAIGEDLRDRFIRDTAADVELQTLKKAIMGKWPAEKDKIPKIIRAYEPYIQEITYEDGLLLKGDKIIVPRVMIQSIMAEAHAGHCGISTTLRRLRQTLFWNGLSVDAKNYVEQCAICQQTQRANTKEPLLLRDIPEYPFQLVSTDIFKFKGNEYILLADHYSGFSDFRKLKSSTSTEVILLLSQWFSVHGIPEILESDGGPQYSSKLFREFSSKWQFKHRISSPHYPQSNGFAERNVQTVKGILKRCWMDGTDPYLAMSLLRNTPRNETLGSPVQRLFSRQTRTILPTNIVDLKPKIINGVTEELRELRTNQKRYVDRVAIPRLSFEKGENVRMQTNHREWKPAKVVEITENPRSVIVETPDGRKYRRNSIHIHTTKAKIPLPISPSIEFETTNSRAGETTPATGNTATNTVQTGENAPREPTCSTRPSDTEALVKVSRYGRKIKPAVKYDPSL